MGWEEIIAFQERPTRHCSRLKGSLYLQVARGHWGGANFAMYSETRDLLKDLQQTLGRLRNALKELAYGATLYELETELRRERKALEDMLFLMIFGDMLGLPFFPPYFSLRLLPFLVPRLESWKRSMLREKDITEVFAKD